MAQCPAHDDGRPSLSVRAGDGQVLLYCFAGCTTEGVRVALGLSWGDLFDNPRGKSWRYDDGRVVTRTPDKRFRQAGNTKATPSLYRLAEVRQAVTNGQTVYLVEGEKDADNLRMLAGVTATTAPQGATNFHLVDAEPLRGATVVAIVDADDAGQRWAEAVRSALKGVAASVRFARAASGKDASDHLAAGHDLDALVPLEGGPGQHLHVLDDVRDWLSRFLLTVTDADLDLLALWAAHTHVALECYTTPRLLFDSPVPGSGKTTALDHLSRLCLNPVQMAAVSSPALLARILENEVRTLLIDEADRTLRPDKEGTPDLLAMLNSGYRRGATRPVLVPVKGGGWEPKEMPTFAPVAMAGNSPNLPDDTRSRVIRVLLLPDLDGRVEESDWELIDGDARALGARLAAWAEAHRDTIAAARPDLPEGIVGRLREKWAPLLRVATVYGGRWPATVADLARQDREQLEMDKEDGMVTTRPHVVLLHHLAEVWPTGATFAATAELVRQLVDEHPTMWGDASPYGKALTVQRCGRMMAQHYKVNTGRADDPARTRGYHLEALRPVWGRMGIRPPVEPVRPANTVEPVSTPPGSTASPGLTGSTGGSSTPDAHCPLHRTVPVPKGCYTCAANAGQGWDE